MYKLNRVIGHRGIAAHAPENTLEGIRLAAALGFRWIEIDARVTRDGVVVLSHDDSLRRCGGGARRLSRMRAATASSIAVPCGMKEFAQARVPLLEDALRLVDSLNIGVVVEIKSNRGEEEKAATATVEVLHHRLMAQLMVSSFSLPVLLATRRLLPHARLAWNISQYPADWQQQATYLALENIHFQHRHLTAAQLYEMKAFGLGLYCFTINSVSEYQEVIAQGADGIFSDFPLHVAAHTANIEYLSMPDRLKKTRKISQFG